jgi:hypothetical protein
MRVSRQLSCLVGDNYLDRLIDILGKNEFRFCLEGMQVTEKISLKTNLKIEHCNCRQTGQDSCRETR